MTDWVLRGGLVLKHAKHTPEPLDIYIKAGRIEQMGPPGLAVPAQTKVFEAGGYLIHPGLVNAHTHGHGAVTKGLADRWNLEQLILAGSITNQERALDLLQLNAQLNAAEMLLKGCTAAFDLYAQLPVPSAEGLEAVAAGYEQSGLRVVLAPMFADQNLYQALPDLALAVGEQPTAPLAYDAVLQNIKPVLTRSYQRVQWALGPAIPLVSSDAFLADCSQLARELGILIHTHVLESPIQKRAYPQRYAGGLLQHLDRIGVLGAHWVLAHCVWLDQNDLALVAKHQAKIVHNPGSNLRLGSGIADMRDMLRHGITVGVGTDGSTSSDNQNMYEAMRLAALVSRVKTEQVDQWISAEDAFYAATEGSAACLSLKDQIGRLESGFKADLVLIDLAHINWQPLNHALRQLVYAEDATAVRHVMVDGTWVVQNQQLLRLNLVELKQKAEQARQVLQLRSQLETPAMQQFFDTVAQFCACQADHPG